MPFVGIKSGSEVWPDDVSDDERVDCPSCEKEMYVRRSHRRGEGVFVVRHFVHNTQNGCGGVETPEHKLLKYAVSRALADLFPHAEIYKEKAVGERRADVLAEFPEPLAPHGYGVVGEAQVKNQDKDIEAVTKDYLDNGYSVYWVTLDALDGLEIELPPIINAWPNVVPDHHDWTGFTKGYSDVLDVDHHKHPIEVKLPREAIKADRKRLKLHWKLGAVDLDYDLIKKLDDKNAGRGCVSCGEDADLYLFKDGVVSEFRCLKHFTEDI